MYLIEIEKKLKLKLRLKLKLYSKEINNWNGVENFFHFKLISSLWLLSNYHSRSFSQLCWCRVHRLLTISRIFAPIFLRNRGGWSSLQVSYKFLPCMFFWLWTKLLEHNLQVVLPIPLEQLLKINKVKLQSDVKFHGWN